MSNLIDLCTKTLRNKQLHRSTGAIAGLASAFSVMVGTLAAYATPKGWGRVTMALHMTKKPFLVKVAPIVTGVAVTLATAAGLIGFFVWWMEGRETPKNGTDRDSLPK
jgi:ABC-type spermidine/putrescine transport system permease subunit II